MRKLGKDEEVFYGEYMSIVIEFIANLGLETVKEKISDAVAEIKVKERIKNYLATHQSYNFNVSLDEEIDFGGLAEFVKTDLLDDVKLRCFGDKSERRSARQRIMEQSVSYASANTALSAQRTMKIVGGAVDILHSFFRSRVNKDLLFVAGEIEDTIKEEHDETRDLIIKNTEHIETVIQKSSALSIDSSVQQIESGKITDVEHKLGAFMDAISSQHELFPYFGYRMTTENKMISMPLTDEARKKYPENFKITAASVRLGNQSVTELGRSIFDQSYRHQLPIYIDVINARKYLGNVLDPIQTEANEMVGAHAIIKPPALPPAFPCNIVIGSEIIVPYLLMRTKEILDDGSVIITNEEQQNFRFMISIRMFLAEKKVTFTVKPSTPSNKECLAYRMFLKRALSGEMVTMYALNLNERLMQGTLDKADTGDLEAEIEFLQKIVSIEDYFNAVIDIPENISVQDHVVINRLYDLIHGGFVGSAKKFDFTFELNDEVRTRILEIPNMEHVMVYSAEGTFSVFNQEFVLPIMRKIECVVFENLSRLKEKAAVLDNGDQIKITLIPKAGENDCKFTDKIKTEDVEREFLFSEEN